MGAYIKGMDMSKDCRECHTTKKKAELKENGDWECPDVGCDECDHHRTVEWCSLAIPNHEEIDDTYKMVNEAFFEGFDAAEKRYRLLIETIEELDKKLSESSEASEWIPCNEKLPPKRQSVLITTDDCYVGEGCYWETTKYHVIWKGYKWNATYWDDKVVAWMSMPRPYVESEVEE